MAHPASDNWCWLGTTLHCLVLASGGLEPFHDECPYDVAVWATLWGDIVASMTGAVYPPNAVARLLADEGQPTATVCQCSGWCPFVRRAPKFEWMQQSKMAECWKHMVPKLVRASVRFYLTACLMSNGGSGAQYVTRKSTKLEVSWEWLPKCCMLLTTAKACGCERRRE